MADTYTERLRQWVRAAPIEDGLEYEDEVMWGVSFNLNDETRAPAALFYDKEQAEKYAADAKRAEWLVAPYVCHILGRNDYRIPEEE